LLCNRCQSCVDDEQARQDSKKEVGH
jgi:hypothetical protein